MATPAKIVFTPFDEYLQLEAKSDTKHEWINGLIYAMSRGTPEHGRLSAAMVRALPQTSDGRVYSSDTLLYIEKAALDICGREHRLRRDLDARGKGQERQESR